MKTLNLILASMVLFAGVSFAQQANPDPAKSMPQNNKSAKTEKKAPAKKADKKADKKASTGTPAK
jgi:hypothetical protein